MLDEELEDRIKESILVCDKHLIRLNFASSTIEERFPLDPDTFNALTNTEQAFIDQLIYRFSKLQDIIGKRVFNEVLQLLSEDAEGLPFIDILNKLEHLNIIDDSKTWLKLRQSRNTVTHEYPTLISDQIEGLNVLYSDVDILAKIWENLKAYILQRMELSS